MMWRKAKRKHKKRSINIEGIEIRVETKRSLRDGSIMNPSVNSTPISSGRSKLQIPAWYSQFRACRIAKAEALPAIVRREPLRHGHLRRIRKSPILSNLPSVQPLRAAFRCLNRQRLQSMCQLYARVKLVFGTRRERVSTLHSHSPDFGPYAHLTSAARFFSAGYHSSEIGVGEVVSFE